MVFWPVPNVDSVLVGFDARRAARQRGASARATFALVDAAFQQRRKMLRQSLSQRARRVGGGGGRQVLERAGVDPQARGEQLGVDRVPRASPAPQPVDAPDRPMPSAPAPPHYRGGMSTPVGSNAEGVGDDAVREATGRDRDEWFALLDEAGAAAWTHKAIAGWLVAEHGVDGGGRRASRSAYEQARGIRRPGQRQDGTYEASVSRTVALDTADALRALAAIVTLQLDVDPLALNLTAKHPTARFPLEGGEFVLATVSPLDDGRSSIGLTWGRMPDGSRLADVKARMREWLQAVG